MVVLHKTINVKKSFIRNISFLEFFSVDTDPDTYHGAPVRLFTLPDSLRGSKKQKVEKHLHRSPVSIRCRILNSEEFVGRQIGKFFFIPTHVCSKIIFFFISVTRNVAKFFSEAGVRPSIVRMEKHLGAEVLKYLLRPARITNRRFTAAVDQEVELSQISDDPPPQRNETANLPAKIKDRRYTTSDMSNVAPLTLAEIANLPLNGEK